MTNDTITIFRDEMETIEGIMEMYRSQVKNQDARIQELTGLLELKKANDELNLWGNQLMKSIESDTKTEVLDSVVAILTNLSGITSEKIRDRLGDIIPEPDNPYPKPDNDGFVMHQGIIYKSY